ncbi:3'(2'),5'-bisphosphate nucleotidase CysQ [Aristophania vespae]|uniref:3'(2'),5'-bisphosphate nucleotidase CysQ n=1 Tax=Aristophania vespae TaxID=2697033 RepID=A0A6P1NBW7_9PROT|nr:3'(2'),5'-bisphosphate nucleotidase CysQ [Aristophania vespae]QHI95836.1 3'(2'),5'-bisphosphate nucleotidase CysQ [Aristophania vespae]
MNVHTASTLDTHTLLDLALQIVSEASDIVLAVKEKGFHTQKKADCSPVTEADHASEAHILSRLRRACPEIEAISEEEFSSGIHPNVNGTYWLIDPLDGTRGFANGGDDFAINIGLISGGEPIIGAVAIPAFGQIYGGGKNLGAFYQDSDGRHPIQVSDIPEEGLRVLASFYYGSEDELKKFLTKQNIQSIDCFGSAIKIIRVAEGQADFYPRFGPTMEWDTAAPQAILEAAGGQIYTIDGMRLTYGKPGRLNSPFFCSGKTQILSSASESTEPKDKISELRHHKD